MTLLETIHLQLKARPNSYNLLILSSTLTDTEITYVSRLVPIATIVIAESLPAGRNFLLAYSDDAV